MGIYSVWLVVIDTYPESSKENVLSTIITANVTISR